jgi:hypothetical protein
MVHTHPGMVTDWDALESVWSNALHLKLDFPREDQRSWGDRDVVLACNAHPNAAFALKVCVCVSVFVCVCVCVCVCVAYASVVLRCVEEYS